MRLSRYFYCSKADINYTFELWMVLHKIDCYDSKVDKKDYLDSINRAYDQEYASLSMYKKKKNFEKCLKEIELSNVVDAINRAEHIMISHDKNGHIQHEYKRVRYYDENPSLQIHEAIKSIMMDCGLIKN